MIEPKVLNDRYQLHLGNCLDVLREMPDNSVDAVVTDPPYGIGFMNKKWDKGVPSVDIWKECLRVLKPGGHLLSFAGTRTQHRMAVNIEDAGFEIREMLAWVYGSGMPKSHDVSKAIDKAAGVEREVTGISPNSRPAQTHGGAGFDKLGEGPATINITAPATPEAQQWEGWGSALKPSLEPITLARKPLESTIAANVLEYGTGAINIDGCRVKGDPPKECKGTGWAAQDKKNAEQGFRPTAYYEGQDGVDYVPHTAGRWPANFIHDGSDEVVQLFPQSKTGSAARYFYCAKASKADKNEGLTIQTNDHPTVKPTDLMRYLCRLITPPGGIVLDPFMGSGSTGKAALLEGFNFIGIDQDEHSIEISSERMQHTYNKLGGKG